MHPQRDDMGIEQIQELEPDKLAAVQQTAWTSIWTNLVTSIIQCVVGFFRAHRA